MYYISVTLGTVLFCISGVLFLKKPFYKLAVFAVKQLDTILNSSINEKEKNRQILAGLVPLLVAFFTVSIVLVLCVVLGVTPIFLFQKMNPEWNIDHSSMTFYGSMILGSFSLFLFQNKADYSYWTQLLHTLILDNYNIGKFFFEKESKRLSKTEITPPNSFVVVTGLARAGTTALMNLIYDPEKFHALSYANMPFLLAPNLWRKIYQAKSSKGKERAHGDAIFINENSIEALEEYFFKVFLDDTYIKKESLVTHEVTGELFKKYLRYQELFKSKRTDKTTYLAKNNNFILRYESMRSLDKDFQVILIFRNPICHARSLLAKHKLFTLKQTEDKFVLEYMNWLGHYEFGRHHKYFDLGSKSESPNYEKSSLNYWLVIWLNYHTYILRFVNDENLFLVHYDDLSNRPNELRELLGEKLNVDLELEEERQFQPTNIMQEGWDDVNPELLAKCHAVYQELEQFKINV